MDYFRELHKKILFAIIIALVFALWASLLFNEPISFENSLDSFKTVLLYVLILGFLNSYYFEWLISRTPKGELNQLHLVQGFSGTLVLSFFGVILSRYLQLVHLEDKPLSVFKDESPDFYIISVSATVLFSSLWYFRKFFIQSEDGRIYRHKKIAHTATAQYDALKNQLDPHFLFNSLNVLAALIDEKPKRAQKFTGALARIYRYVLDQKTKDLVGIEEELRFARTYIGLLKMRFEESIDFAISENIKTPDAKIVPLSLQLLLENAVKHNKISNTEPLSVKIYQKKGYLVVGNTWRPKEIIQTRPGLGLENIKKRYAMLTRRKVKVEASGYEFRVFLPLLTHRVKNRESETFFEDKQYKSARRRVLHLKKFYIGLILYLLVIPILIYINFTTSPWVPWVVFPAIFWGFGILKHLIAYRGKDQILGKKWEQRRIKKIMKKDEL